MTPILWTVGHSTRTFGAFADLIAVHGVEVVADVRRYPGSRRWPHFGAVALAEALATRGIGYESFPELGGRRTPRPDSPNTAWRSTQFQGYADYMETEEFSEALTRLANLGCGYRTAIMCSEAVWWRCHRALIADALRWSGYQVRHILSTKTPAAHPYTSAARLRGGLLVYDGVESE